MPKVYIIIVNWNGWQDTIGCLESLFHMDYANFSVVVCDNASGDHSLERLLAWAGGDLVLPVLQPSSTFPSTPCPKPIPSLRITPDASCGISEQKLVFVEVGENAGFAGGSNVGLQLALDTEDLEYVWLLNNDTVVDRAALSAMVRRMQKSPEVGICGSTLLYLEQPEVIQALGGSIYNRWTGRGGHIAEGKHVSDALPVSQVESMLKYVIGASMLVSASFLREVGLLNEDYFLYFEEIDWATRAKGCYRLAYSPDSIVYHRAGSSTGSNREQGGRSSLAEYYAASSRVKFTSEYYPYALPTVCMTLFASAMLRLVRGRWQNCAALFSGALAGFRGHSRHPLLAGNT